MRHTCLCVSATPASIRADSVDQELQQLDGGENGTGENGADKGAGDLRSPVPSLAVTPGDYGRVASEAGSITERSTLLRLV